MKKGLFLVVAIIAMVIMLSISVSAEAPIEEWQLVSSNMGTMTASVYEDSENGGLRLEIVSVPTRPTSPITMPNNVNSNWAEYRDRITSVFVSEGTYTISSNAFADLTALKSVELSQGLVRIDNNAFVNCTSLVEVRFPSTVTTANGGTFRNCTSLVSVELSEGLTSIGGTMFTGCIALQSINIPDKVTSIGYDAFSGCTALGSVTISSSVKNIGNNAFRECTSLTSVVIPEGVTSVGYNVFQNCTALTEFTLPSTLTKISDGMFRYCTSLTEVVIPDTVQVINGSAFSDCTSLESITIGSGVTTIYGNAFTNCKLLTVVYIPQNVTRVEAYAFRNCKNIVFYVESPEEEVLANWNSAWNSEKCTVYYNASGLHVHNYERTVTKEPTHFEAGVAELYCAECGDVQTQTINKISHSYKSEITKEATHFEAGIRTYSCDCGYSYDVSISIIPHSYVSEITKEPTHLEEGVLTYTCSCGDSYTEAIDALPEHTYVDGYCECGARNVVEEWVLTSNTYGTLTAILTNDYINDGYVLEIAADAVDGRTLTMPYNAYNVWASYKTEITSVVVGENVSTISDRAFSGFNALTSVELGADIVRTGNGVFENCTSLKEIQLPIGFTTMGNNMFRGCTALESVTIPETVTSIGSFVFYGCRMLAEVTVPSGVTNIGNSAFENCTSLKEIQLPIGFTTMGNNMFKGCTALESVTIPETVTSIGPFVFYGCKMLTEVTVPSGVTNIGNSVFENCSSLVSVTLPNDVENMGIAVFKGCSVLASVALPQGIKSIGMNMFQGCTSLTSVVIPNGVVSIGDSAFRFCYTLANVTIPESVESLGRYAFADCRAFTSIIIPSGVTEIGNDAFTACTNLVSVEVPATVVTMGSYAFSRCTKLTIKFEGDAIPETWNANWNPQNRPVELGDVHIHVYTDIPEIEATHTQPGVTKRECDCGYSYNVEVDIIPHTYVASVTKEATHTQNGVRTYACSCGDYYTEEIPATTDTHSYTIVTVITAATHTTDGTRRYSCECGAYYTETIPALGGEHEYVETSRVEADHYTSGSIRYTCACGSYYTETIEKQRHEFIDDVCSCGAVRGEDPIAIWDISYNTRELVAAYLYHDFENDGLYRLVIRGNGRARYYNLPWKDYKYEISEIVFEDGVKYEVPGRAFEGYSELRKVTIGDGIELIRNGAFRFCEKLVSVEVTGTLRRIENSVFERCIALEEITGIAQLDYLGGYAFASCKSLKQFQAEFIKEVGVRAFMQCESLEKFDVIGGVLCLRDGAFERCTKLCEVGSLEKLEYLGRFVFRDCLEIRKLILNAQLIELVPDMFNGCRGLEVIIIRGDVKEIPRGAFNGCANLETVYIESSTSIKINDYAFQNCNNLKNVIISGGVSYVGMRAFINCKALERVYFDSEIPVTLGEAAFNNCSNLVSVVSSAGFADIGRYAFSGCYKLEKITLSNYTITIGEYAFANCRALKEIYIPDFVEYIGARAFNECRNLTIYANIDMGMFDGCNPQSRPVENYEVAPEEFYCEHLEMEHWTALERTHFNIGLEIYSCSCGKIVGVLVETTPDHDFSQFVSDGAATHTRKCFCGYVETVNHNFTGNVCADCGLQKNVIIYDDIESITASNGFESLEILFDGLKNTTGLKAESDIEYYPTKDKDYVYITLKEEVDLAGITAWVCGNKGHIKITVFGSDGKKTGEGKIELKGTGDYYDYKSVPANITFFGTAAVKYIKIEAEGLAKEGGLVQKISEIDLTLGTKLDLETDKPHTNIELVFDIPTLNAIGIEITPEILEKLSKADLKVESDIGQIILDAISMNKVSGISGNVTIGITDITDEKEVNRGKRVFSITVNDENGNPILPPDQSEENGTLTLSFKYKVGLKKEQIKVVYRDEDGKVQHMEVESYDPVTGIVQFKTNHLSVYEIYAEGESDDGLLEGAFEFKGYSVSTQTGALAIGFSINYDKIRYYEDVMEKSLDFGVVFASFDDLGGKNPFDGNGNPFELENSNVISMSLTDYEYTDYTFVIGEMTEEYFDHSFVISAYAKGVEGVWYYQDKGMCDTVDGITYNEVLEFEILE